MAETFGALLRQHREALPGPATRANRYEGARFHQSLDEVAKRAFIDKSYLCLLERGDRALPRRETVERLAVALELDEPETDRLFVAAGLWPWPQLAGDTLGEALRIGRTVLRHQERVGVMS
jgi:transcriptional regulator with XRE-family HTH domain